MFFLQLKSSAVHIYHIINKSFKEIEKKDPKQETRSRVGMRNSICS